MCIPCIIFLVGNCGLYMVIPSNIWVPTVWVGWTSLVQQTYMWPTFICDVFFQRQMRCKMIVGGLGVDVGYMMLSKIWIRKRILPSTYYCLFVLWSSIALSHQEVTTTTIGYFWENHRKSWYSRLLPFGFAGMLVFDWSVAKTRSCTHSHDSLWFSMYFCKIAISKGTMMVYQWNTLRIPYI
jgi:hypothetical protein